MTEQTTPPEPETDVADPRRTPPERRTGLTAYRRLPRLAGWGYLVATALGRLPLSMVPLAILTLASSATGSIAVGGLAAAAAALGEAVGAPLGGALADRHGQRVVLLAGVVLHVAVLVLFVLSAGVLPDATTVALAGLAGVTLPQVGALSRARWLAMAPDDLPAAFAFEGVLDEIVYILGPAAVGIVAVTADARAAVIAAGVLVVVFASWFAVHPSHRRVPRRGEAAAVPATADAPRPSPGRRRLLVGLTFAGMLSMGVFFGGSQTGLTAFAGEQGIPDAGALLYAVMAVGSAVTTVSMVAVPASIGPWTRWSLAAAGMTGGAILMSMSTSVPAVVAAAVVAGAFQGPLLLTVFSVAGSLAENGRAGAMMTFIASGVVVGLGIGSAVAGGLAESWGSGGAFAVVVGASGLLLVMGLAAAAASRRRGAE